VSFVLCRDRFEIEPVPCGTNFHRVDVEVCWEEQTTTTETLNFSACNGLSVALSDCAKSCVTTLEYKGPGATTNAAITLHGNAIIAANGTGALVLSTAIAHGGSCNRTLTLSGNNTANNAITAAIGDPTGGTTAVTKSGTGVWVLSGASSFSGNLLVKQGTLVGGVNSVGTTGAFGAGSVVEMFIGDTSPASSGTATLLMDPGVNTTKIISVLSSTGAQQVRIGGRGAGSVDYQGDLWLARNVTLVAGAGSTTAFSGFFYGPGGVGTPTTDVTFGAAGYTGTAQIFRDLETSGDIYVRYGTAEIMATGSIEAQSVTVDAGATLVIRGLASNPGDLVDSATLTNNTLTVAFLGNPASNDQYVLLTGETINDYATVTLTGTSATGTYDSVTSTLTID
jgi:fibronectin-binding autotransporter adhesin